MKDLYSYLTNCLSLVYSFTVKSFLPPANEVCEGYVFTPVSQSFCSQGGGRAWLWGGGAWLQGGMHGCRGCAWLWGACMVVGSVHGCGGCAWLWGACVVVGGHVWLQGGVHGCGGACMGYDEIRSMSGRYASYWNAFLLLFNMSSKEIKSQNYYCIRGNCIH